MVAVPEGLPLAVMLSLAYSVKKMLEDQNFVKRLASCEIMGGANNICSDKTGTLTLNQMTWEMLWQESASSVVGKTFSESVPEEKVREFMTQAVCSNTVGTVADSGATDKAMLKLMERWSVDVGSMRNKYMDLKNLVRFPFDSQRKRMSTVIDVDGGKRCHTKGASEIILATCKYYLDQAGNKKEITDEFRNNLNAQIE